MALKKFFTISSWEMNGVRGKRQVDRKMNLFSKLRYISRDRKKRIVWPRSRLKPEREMFTILTLPDYYWK